jgi:hypothetical protein
MKKFPSAAALAVIVACGASAVSAQVAAGGAMVFIDPVTKQIRQPEPGEVEQLMAKPTAQSPKNASVAQPVMSLVPGGGVGIVLDESTHSYMVVTRRPDGTTLMDCLPSAQQAADAVRNGLSTGEILHGNEVHDVQ